MEDKKREELSLPDYMQAKGGKKQPSAQRAQTRAGQAGSPPVGQGGKNAARKVTLEEFANTAPAGRQSAVNPKKPASPPPNGQRTLSDEMARAPRRQAGGSMRSAPPAAKSGSQRSASSQRAAQRPASGKQTGTSRRMAGTSGGTKAPAASLDMASAQIANRPRRVETAAKRKKAAGFKPARLALVLLVALGLGIAIWYALAGNPQEESGGDGPLVVGSTVKLPKGVSIMGIDVGGQTKTSARNAVTDAADAVLSAAAVTLKLEDETYTIPGSSLGLSYDIDDVLQQALAYEQPKEGGGAVDVTTGEEPGQFNNILTYDQSSLRRALEDIAGQFDIEPVNAIGEPTMHEDHTVTFTYQDGKTGRKLDVEATQEKIEAMFGRGVYTAQIDGVYADKEPAVTAAMLSEEIALRGSFTTRYATIGETSEETPVIENRVFNIHKASDSINGIMVAPGESWSFNSYVGPRTVSGGWKEANGIAYGKEYTLQAGGGICQVSTTLYNALLQAKVTITDRRAHSIPSDYVPHGLDATVDYAMNLDLKFTNDTGAPLYIFVYYEDVEGRHRQDITFLIYGKPLENGVTYKTRSVITDKKERTDVVYTDDPTIPRGYKVVTIAARPSYKAEVYLDKCVGEGVVESTYLYADSYAGNAQEARRGTGSPKYNPVPDKAVAMD